MAVAAATIVQWISKRYEYTCETKVNKRSQAVKNLENVIANFEGSWSWREVREAGRGDRRPSVRAR
jgi:hypothetical protein